MRTLRLNGRRARAAVTVAVAGLAAMVAACSSHDDDRDHTPPPVAVTPTPTPVATDAFVSYVAQVVATQDETGEPASTDGVTLTAPEETEPLPLPGA